MGKRELGGGRAPDEETARFPALLDTGNNFHFSLRDQQLRDWAKIDPGLLMVLGKIKINGQPVTAPAGDGLAVPEHPGPPGGGEWPPAVPVADRQSHRRLCPGLRSSWPAIATAGAARTPRCEGILEPRNTRKNAEEFIGRCDDIRSTSATDVGTHPGSRFAFFDESQIGPRVEHPSLSRESVAHVPRSSVFSVVKNLPPSRRRPERIALGQYPDLVARPPNSSVPPALEVAANFLSRFPVRACLRISFCNKRAAESLNESLQYGSSPHSMRRYAHSPCCASGIAQASRTSARQSNAWAAPQTL